MRLVLPKPQAKAELSIPIRGDGLVPPKRPKGAKADASAVELARGEVGELVAEDFFEESVFGLVEEGGEADQPALGVAAAEASR